MIYCTILNMQINTSYQRTLNPYHHMHQYRKHSSEYSVKKELIIVSQFVNSQKGNPPPGYLFILLSSKVRSNT